MQIERRHADTAAARRPLVRWLGALGLVLAGAGFAVAADEDTPKATISPGTTQTVSIETLAARPMPKPERGEVRRVPFGSALFLDRDMMLRGMHAEGRLPFTRPVSWKVLPGSALHLFITHSGTLLPDHSALTVRVGEAVRTVKLDAKQDEIREIVIPIDPSQLKPYNAIEFTADQHYTMECEDPFNDSLWTRVSRASYIDFVIEEQPVFSDLSVFPFPYFDSLAYPPARLSFVLPNNPSAGTATAIANLAGSIAQEIAYRPIQIDFLDAMPEKAENHLIVIGTPEENSSVGPLLEAAKISPPSGDEGVLGSVALAGDPLHAALVVSGATGEAVERSAATLADRITRATLSGTSARVAEYSYPEPAGERDWYQFVPDRASFTFREVGFQDETVRGVFSAPIKLDLKMQPDSQPVEFQQKLNVHYAYSSKVNVNISAVEVQMNGVSIHSASLNKQTGSDSEWLKLELPWDIYGPYNKLQIIFHLYPQSYKECERIAERQLWGTIFADSNFTLPKDYWLEIPDLSSFARWGFPFTIRPDLSETAVILPGPANQAAIHGLIRLVTFLGGTLPRRTTQMKVYYADSVPPEVLQSKHLVFVSPDPTGPLGTELGARALTLGEEGRLQLKDGDRERLMTMLGVAGLTIEELASPWSDKHVALVLQEGKEGQYATLMGTLSEPGRLDLLRGAVAVVSPPDTVNTFEIGPTSLLGHIPLLRRLRYLFSVYWQFFLVLAAFGVLALFVAFRRLINRRKERLAHA